MAWRETSAPVASASADSALARGFHMGLGRALCMSLRMSPVVSPNSLIAIEQSSPGQADTNSRIKSS